MNNTEATGITYKCLKCGIIVTAEQLSITPEIKCRSCGFRVLKKNRPPVVKRVKSD
ncbi:RNA polymerase Rbp10 [Candidatus Bathyarchaeota archaeon]|nr:RNA polymerase Rbp10 [Candidatus Bathyarchaeota archaeon]